MSKYFYHGVGRNYPYDVVMQILTTGGIKSRHMIGRTGFGGYNGLDYISLCSKEDDEEARKYYSEGYLSAYDRYIFNNYCLIISDQIQAVKTENVLPGTFETTHDLAFYMDLHPSKRISPSFDEWQAKDMISLDDIIGIGLPMIEIMSKIKQDPTFEAYLKMILGYADKLGLDVVDSSEDDFIVKYEETKIKDKNKIYRIDIKKNK